MDEMVDQSVGLYWSCESPEMLLICIVLSLQQLGGERHANNETRILLAGTIISILLTPHLLSALHVPRHAGHQSFGFM